MRSSTVRKAAQKSQYQRGTYWKHSPTAADCNVLHLRDALHTQVLDVRSRNLRKKNIWTRIPFVHRRVLGCVDADFRNVSTITPVEIHTIQTIVQTEELWMSK